MYLKSLELSGFKSFAKKNSFEFNSPVSAIVGPNGSGKSNVAEAMRFVLGEQSIKSMRGKKGEDLIWNGAQSEPRANRASVKAVFDNSKKLFDIDFPEVSIERVVHRDGENEYSINGSTARLKDVVELLSSAHIGASGHHIISQGEADKILNANTKERKSLVEDALGLKLYQYKRIESERKLKKTFENVAQVEALRKEISPHLKFLKKQVEKLEKAEHLRDELIDLAKKYFKSEDTRLASVEKGIKEEREPIDTKLKKLDEELASAKKILAKEDERGEKNSTILELESKLSHTRVHKDALARELGKVEGLISAEERIVRKQEELVNTDEHKMVRLKDVEELAREIEAEEEGQGLFARIKEKISNFIKSQRAVADSQTLVDARASLKKFQEEKLKVEKDFQASLAKEKSLQEEYETLKKEVEKERDTSHTAEKEVFRIMSEENELNSNLNMIMVREEKLRGDKEDFKREVEEVGRLVGTEVLHYKDTDSPTEVSEKDQEETRRELAKMKVRLEDSNLAGSAELYKEYKDTSERDEFLAKELVDLERSAEALKELIKDLEERLATEFENGLKKINTEFDKLFSKVFGGGEAHLILTKESVKRAEIEGTEDEEIEDVEESEAKVEEGLDIKISLPRKKVKSLLMLSGGERALTSIALTFAISQVNPPPFIVLDETDAALDESNSKKYGDMVEVLSKHSQLILITHNRETMSRAGIIYGVTMGSDGVSKLLSIEFDEAIAVAK